MSEKHYYMVFIDTENCSPKTFKKMLGAFRRFSKDYACKGIYCVGLEKDRLGRGRSWHEVTRGYSGVFWRYLPGQAEKNKVDERVINLIEQALSRPDYEDVDLYYIMSSDGDYTDIVKKIVGNKKRKAIVVGKANASKKLQDTSTLFLDWDV
jgi:hypothetical protein